MVKIIRGEGGGQATRKFKSYIYTALILEGSMWKGKLL